MHAPKRRGVIIACLIVLGLGGTWCSGALAAEKAIWGPTVLPGGESAFPTYRRLGVDTLQLQLVWPKIAPTRPRDASNPDDPAYRWPADVDQAVSDAADHGIALALLVRGSPPWANGGLPDTHVPDATTFAAFVEAAARRYRTVRRWMIWGEPNRADRFRPNAPNSPAGPRAYALMLDTAYLALKRVSRRNVVIGGMTWTGGTVKPEAFLRLMRLPDGRRPRLDWFGHNPFPFRFPNIREPSIGGGWRDMSDMDTFSRELRRNYGRRARLWLSEFTVLSDRPSRAFAFNVTRRGQARWLSAAYRIADELPSIAGLGWLGLLDEPAGPDSSNFGLMTSDGARKPAYAAYGRAPAMRFRPRVRAASRVRATRLLRGGLRVAVRVRLRGRVAAELRSRRERTVARAAGRGRAGALVVLRLRGAALARGRYTVVVRAPRAAAVRRSVLLR